MYRALAIKDEVWVATLLTSPEKYKRDAERFNIDPARGDTISYQHFNRPAFTLFGKTIEFDLNSRDWMLRLMSHARFLRRVLIGWHKREGEFRDWYLSLVERFTYVESDQDYEFYVEALKVHEKVTGYRDIRYPRMDAAVRTAEELLQKIGSRRTETRAAESKSPSSR